MIQPDFLIFNENGLYCTIGNFYLDPQKPVAQAVISHAHGDHAKPGNAQVYCTSATAAIMQLRFKKNAAENFHLMQYHQSFKINGVDICFIPAGHILGSAQILMEYDGVKYLYTGDFKLQQDATCEPLEFIQADVLITESTFANPDTIHPDPVDEIKKINHFSHNILLGAYALGKSQRLINLITQHCVGRKIMVHHAILPLNKVYERFSYAPGNYEPYNRKLMKNPEQGYVYIVPPMTFHSFFRAKNVMRVFASGWKNLQQSNDLALFISDHADWGDILQLIERVGPTEIWTLHGNGAHLQKHFENSLPVKILQ